MARSSECKEQCAQKVLDTADIVREAMLRQSIQPGSSSGGILWKKMARSALHGTISKSSIFSWLLFVLGGVIESVLLFLCLFLRIKVLFPMVLFPGLLLQFVVAGNAHDYGPQWAGIAVSWCFWSIVF